MLKDMKNSILVLAALVATLGLNIPSKATSLDNNERTLPPQVLAQAQSSWVLIKPDGEYFEFEMPGTPKDQIKKQPFSNLPIRITVRVFGFSAGIQNQFLVSYTDFGTGGIGEQIFANKKQLDEISLDTLKSVGKANLFNQGRSISMKVGSINYPGREYRQADGLFVVRLYGNINRIYTVMAITNKQEDTERFVNSFKFL